jgi:hypothetical protein
MIRVKTFTAQMQIFHIMKELGNLDKQVNDFLESNQIRRVISASDAITTGTSGEAIGIVRILTYEEP